MSMKFVMHTSYPTGTSLNVTTFLFDLSSHSEQLSVLPADTVSQSVP
jgi:hypothetical protein